MKTAELLSQTLEQPGISLQDFGKGRLGHQIGVLGMEKVLTAAFADIQEKNPNAYTVKIYRLFAEQLPHLISSESQTTALQAIKSEDPNISQAATTTFILLNMRSISSAAELYYAGNPDQDNDLIQAGITCLLTKISEGTLVEPGTVPNRVHGIAVYGIAQEIANREEIPVSWVRGKIHTNTIKLIEESFADYPFGLTTKQMQGVAKSLSEKIGIPAKSILSVIKDKNSLTKNLPRDEDDAIDAALLASLKKAIPLLLNQFTKREAFVIEAVFGFLDRDYDLEEIGELIGLKGDSGRNRAGQIRDRALRILRHPSRSKKLKPYLFPEEDPHLKRPTAQPAFINMQTLMDRYAPSKPAEITKTEVEPAVRLVPNNSVTEARLKYRYPLIRCWEIGLLQVSDSYGNSISDKLAQMRIDNLTQLLAASDSDLESKGFTAEEIQSIKLNVTKFLERDSKVVTLGDSSRPLLDALR